VAALGRVPFMLRYASAAAFPVDTAAKTANLWSFRIHNHGFDGFAAAVTWKASIEIINRNDPDYPLDRYIDSPYHCSCLD
jgi:hypothetical protein